jgi:peptidyl-prolyl cis-trans isomerase D
MLSGMRAFAKSPWALVLFALLIVALGLTFNDAFSGVQGGGFVKAGSRSVAARDINRELDRYINQQREESGTILTQKEAAAQGVPEQLVADLSQQAMLLAYADRIGVAASLKSVTTMIAEAPRFKDGLGQVSLEEVGRYANEQGFLNVEQFEGELRSSFTQRYVRDSLFAGLAAPEILSRPLTAYLGEQRTLTIARLSPASMPPFVEPTGDQLAAFYKEKGDVFRLPEMRQISVLSYSKEDFLDKASVTEAEIAKDYEARKKEFSTPETRTITEYSGANRNAVQDVVDKVAQGVKLEDAIAQTPGVSVAQKTVKQSDIANPDYGNVVFSLPAAGSFGPLEIEGVFYGVRVDGITPGVPTPLADVQDRIRSELAARAGERLYDQSDEVFYEMVQDGASLEDIAAQIGAPVISYSGIDLSGRMFGQPELSALSANADLLQGAFRTASGAIGEIVDKDGVRSIARVDAIEPERLPDLAEVRDQVRLFYRDEQQREIAGKIIDQVLAEVTAGAPLEVAATKAKLMVVNPPQPLIRADNRTLDPGIMDAAFKAAAGSTFRANDSNGEPWILRVNAVTPVTPEVEAQIGQQVRQQVQQTLSVDMQQVFLQAVQKQVKVRRNEGAIQRYIDSFKEPVE